MQLLKQPSEEYLRISEEPSHSSQQTKKQLLILDLNGTLISRLKTNGRGYYARPHYEQFLEFIFKHFTVMVWSSARQQSVQMMCKIFKQPLELVWNRNHFELDRNQFYGKTETIKDLNKVWHHFSNQYGAKSTIILDDTDSKLVYQPYNLIHVKTFDFKDIIEGATDNELLRVIRYLDVLRLQSNVASFIRNNPFNAGKDYEIITDYKLDAAMVHYNKKGHIIQMFKRPKRALSDDDHTEEKQPAKKKKKNKKQKTKSTVIAPPIVASTDIYDDDDDVKIPLRPQTKKKLKSIVNNIKQKKKPKA
ncbi:hypothetical protein INT46_011306 [Mucor plumbeus]|uniref:Mitochondrial import inner membrane translocase subunit TIM50 n=1 Tax=Mucor plumbeus TaxID=97098 RepID=A0A8H7QJQ9_9FUNG|nr:hypothetical protein INT46_011306 [Mucor plumbeus]